MLRLKQLQQKIRVALFFPPILRHPLDVLGHPRYVT